MERAGSHWVSLRPNSQRSRAVFTVRCLPSSPGDSALFTGRLSTRAPLIHRAPGRSHPLQQISAISYLPVSTFPSRPPYQNISHRSNTAGQAEGFLMCAFFLKARFVSRFGFKQPKEHSNVDCNILKSHLKPLHGVLLMNNIDVIISY